MLKVLLTRFNQDILWNLSSFGLMAVLGLVIQVIIMQVYDTAALGVFSQLYAIYLLLSQLAVGGVQLSVLSFVPRYNTQTQHQGMILSSSLVVVITLSLALISLALMGGELVNMLYSPEVGQGYIFILPGLLFFSVNKVLNAAHNGNRRMVAFALFNLLRFVFMLLSLLGLIWWRVPAFALCALLSIAEATLCIVNVLYTMRFFSFNFSKRTMQWMRLHLRFGARALLGNFLLDVNTKVDILMLGMFTNNALIGLYAIAAQIFEGLMLLPAVFRNNINPVISKAYYKHGSPVLERVIRKTLRPFYLYIGAVAIASLPVFPIVIWMYGIEAELVTAWGLYTIMVMGLVIGAGYIPYYMIFNQLGKPQQQTVFFIFFFASNVVFNWLFISAFGVFGAAIGTSAAIVASVFVLKWMLRHFARVGV